MDWESHINPEQKNHSLPRKTVLKLPAVANPHLEQNIPFAAIPGTDRQLFCDIWQPPKNIIPLGLAFIYLHGSAWYLLDKDLGTRPFFSHLTAQGHVMMAVAYRLAPETDMTGMVNDVKQAMYYYYYTNQHLTTRSTPDKPKKAVLTKMPQWMIQRMGEDNYYLGFDKGFENAGDFASLFSGYPDECPEIYTLYSPVTHVHAVCPPTLLIHDEHDL